MKKKLTILQEEISDCGVCSLLSIIRYYKGDVPLEQLRINSLTDRSGVTAYNLIECAKIYNLEGIGLKVEKIEEKHLPCIAHLNINKSLSHFVTVYKVTEEYLVIMDPSIGMIKINKDKFYKEFTNIILYFVPTNQLPSLKNKRIVISTIHKYIKNYKLQIISVIILNISYVILSILSSTYSAFINHNLFIISTIFILFNICTSLIKYSINKKMNKLIHKIDNSLSKDIFNHILNLPIKYLQFKDKGEIIKRIEDAEVIKELELTYVIKTILNIMMILPLIILIGTQVKEIYSLTIILILLYIIVNKNYHKNINKCIEKEIRDSTNYNNYLINMINGIASIYHASSNNYFIDNILKLKNNKNQSTYNLTNLTNKYELKNNIIIKSIEIILNIILLLKLQNNLLSITTVFIINILFAQLITSLLEVISFIPINRYKKRLVNKVDEFLNIENDTEETNYINKLDITIKDLSFSYNSLNNTIKNINLNFKKGENYLIQSKNGTGKSTIFKLLTKELTKYEGSIMIGNEELKDISYREINKKISFISQDETIFPGTIKDNILLGLDVHHKTLNKIIKLCELDELINKKPFGLDTFLYGGGEELSGGEKQLIILARFLIRNKDILIIDEATSELNPIIEDKIIKNITNYYKDKTIIFVSHKNKEYLFKNIINLY